MPDGRPKELVADKGYHSNQALVDYEAIGLRTYISEPDRGRRNWQGPGKTEARDAVYRNRRRIRGARGKRLLRQRGERLERPNAHLYTTGAMRRVHLRGHANILKRLLIHVAGLNLGLLMRALTGVGTPRSLQGRAVAALAYWRVSATHDGPLGRALDPRSPTDLTRGVTPRIGTTADRVRLHDRFPSRRLLDVDGIGETGGLRLLQRVQYRSQRRQSSDSRALSGTWEGPGHR